MNREGVERFGLRAMKDIVPGHGSNNVAILCLGDGEPSATLGGFLVVARRRYLENECSPHAMTE